MRQDRLRLNRGNWRNDWGRRSGALRSNWGRRSRAWDLDLRSNWGYRGANWCWVRLGSKHWSLRGRSGGRSCWCLGGLRSTGAWSRSRSTEGGELGQSEAGQLGHTELERANVAKWSHGQLPFLCHMLGLLHEPALGHLLGQLPFLGLRLVSESRSTTLERLRSGLPGLGNLLLPDLGGLRLIELGWRSRSAEPVKLRGRFSEPATDAEGVGPGDGGGEAGEEVESTHQEGRVADGRQGGGCRVVEVEGSGAVPWDGDQSVVA